MTQQKLQYMLGLSSLYTFTSYDSPAPIIWGGMNPIFRWENWSTGKVKWLAQSITAAKWWCWDLNPRQLVRNHNSNHWTICKDRVFNRLVSLLFESNILLITPKSSSLRMSKYAGIKLFLIHLLAYLFAWDYFISLCTDCLKWKETWNQVLHTTQWKENGFGVRRSDSVY